MSLDELRLNDSQGVVLSLDWIFSENFQNSKHEDEDDMNQRIIN